MSFGEGCWGCWSGYGQPAGVPEGWVFNEHTTSYDYDTVDAALVKAEEMQAAGDAQGIIIENIVPVQNEAGYFAIQVTWWGPARDPISIRQAEMRERVIMERAGVTEERTDEEKKGFPWWGYLGIGLGVVAAGGLIYAIVRKR